MAAVGCLPSPSPDRSGATIKRAAGAVVQSLAGICKPTPAGAFSIDGVTYTIQLDVSVPTDIYGFFKRAFYGLWLTNCICRLATDCLPKFKFELLSAVPWIEKLASAGHAFKISGIAFNVMEGAIATIDFCKAMRRFFKARQALTPEMLRAHDDAKAKMLRLIAERNARRRDGGPREADEADSAPNESMVAHDPHIADPDAAEIEAGAPPPPAAVAPDSDAASSSADKLTPAQCNAYLKCVVAKCEIDQARVELINTGLAWGRDAVAQGSRAGWDLACEFARFCTQNLGPGISYVGTGLIGIGHVAAGLYERRRAKQMIRALETAIAASDNYQPDLQHPEMGHRLASEYARVIFDRVQKSRRAQASFGKRLRSWGNIRMCYGAFTVLLAGGGIAASVLLAGTALATAGLILIPLAVTVGSIWLGHAVQKGVARNNRREAIEAERVLVEDALRVLNGSAANRRAKTIDRLEDWPLDSLVALAGSSHFTTNRYLTALIATKYLKSREIAGLSAETMAAMKVERLRATAALQALGMSKVITAMLKRNTFEHSLGIMVNYMYGGVEVHAHA